MRRINTDGTIKAKETTENLGELSILLNEGNNTIKILNYSAEITAKYVVKSDYTEAFATKVEMNSEIKQTAESIDVSVNKKLKNYSTTTEMNSAIKVSTDNINSVVKKKVGKDEIISEINQSAENLTIDSNRININGTVSANGNFEVDKKRKYEMYWWKCWRLVYK